MLPADWQDSGTLIIRICQLEVHDMFLLNGTWQRVFGKDDEDIRFAAMYNGKYDGRKGRIGAKSQQFVEVVRPQAEVE